MESDLEALERLSAPMTKAELLERIPPAHAALEAVIAPLDETELNAPSPDGWSIKDHLLHLAAWKRLIIAHVRGEDEAAMVGVDPEVYATLDTEELNRRLHSRDHALPVTSALKEWRAAHAEITALAESLDDAALTARYWEDEPEGRTVIEKVAGDTYGHDLEHRRWIIEMLKTRGPG